MALNDPLVKKYSRKFRAIFNLHSSSVAWKHKDGSRIKENTGFRELEHWSPSEKEALLNDKRFALIRDRMRNNFNTLDGIRLKNKPDYKFYSRDSNAATVSIIESGNSVVSHIDESSSFDQVERDIAWDAYTYGRGWGFIYHEENGLDNESQIIQDYIDYLDIYPDPSFKGRKVNHIKNGCRWIAIQTKMTKQEIRRIYPETKGKVIESNPDNILDPFLDKGDEFLGPNDDSSDLETIIDLYEKQYLPIVRVDVFRKVPSLLPVPDDVNGGLITDEAGQPAQAQDQDTEGIDQFELEPAPDLTRFELEGYQGLDDDEVKEVVVKDEENKYDWFTFKYTFLNNLNGSFLDAEILFFLNGKLPFFCQTWDVTKEGLDFSYVDEWKDAQRSANRVYSTMMDGVNKGGFAFMTNPNGALDEDDLKNAKRGDRTTVKVDVKALQGAKPEIMEMPKLSPELVNLYQITGLEMDERRQIADVQEGNVSSATRSAQQFQAQLLEAEQTNMPMIKSIQTMHEERLRVLMDFIPVYILDSFPLFVGDEQVDPSAFIEVIENDSLTITVDEGQNSPARKAEIRAQLEFYKGQGGWVPNEMLVNTLNIPEQEKLVGVAKAQDEIVIAQIKLQQLTLAAQLQGLLPPAQVGGGEGQSQAQPPQ